MFAGQSPQMRVPSIEGCQTGRTEQNWTLTADFYLVAVQDTMTHNGAPDIFNTDQGCQFTSPEFTGLLTQRTSASAWMAKAAGGITHSSNGSGGVSHIKRCIALLSKTGL